MPLTVGMLARRCGITVRTLHYYDQTGLLKPSGRSTSGYRLYLQAGHPIGPDVLAWLQRQEAAIAYDGNVESGA